MTARPIRYQRQVSDRKGKIFYTSITSLSHISKTSRLESIIPEMLDKGLKGMVGKGKRSPEVIEAMKRNGAVYFAAVGGAGALLSKCIKKAEVIAYDDLGTEAIRKLEIENLPVIVVIVKDGNNLYETAKDKWKK